MTSSASPFPFFDHSRHKLNVHNLDAPLDVLTFHGIEGLSQLFTYTVEFTSSHCDLGAEQLLGKRASFSLCPVPQKHLFLWQPPPVNKPFRTLDGVVTGFKRLSGSNDEARYEII
uniref:contractile injection system protein, VgrG/Pvc8 family n=1 Tax=Pseudomonas sp. MWU16-30323 TaxID=2878094 RepID=UPI0031FC4C47